MNFYNDTLHHENRKALLANIWGPCPAQRESKTEISLMGYSMRTLNYRYTGYVHFDRSRSGGAARAQPRVMLDELYDHTKDGRIPSVDRETVNVAEVPEYQVVRKKLKDQLCDILARRFDKRVAYPVI
jgi:hypothetical protein